MLSTSAAGISARVARRSVASGKNANSAPRTDSASAAAISRGLTVRAVNSFLGETVPASRTASRVISLISRSELSISPIWASSTTVERRSSSSGWLRSISAAISAAVNLRLSGLRSETHATAPVPARPALHSSQRIHAS